MKIVKIQNEFKVISALKTTEIERLEKANQNVLYDDKKPVFGVSISNTTASFTGKNATFDETSDNGYAMLTITCDSAYAAKFESDEAMIKDFTENNLEAITNLNNAEEVFTKAIEKLNKSVADIVAKTETITIE